MAILGLVQRKAISQGLVKRLLSYTGPMIGIIILGILITEQIKSDIIYILLCLEQRSETVIYRQRKYV